MKTKKSKSSGVTTRTWIFFGIFLIVAFYCLKVVYTAQQVANSIVIPAPVVVQIPTKTPTPVHKVIKK